MLTLFEMLFEQDTVPAASTEQVPSDETQQDQNPDEEQDLQQEEQQPTESKDLLLFKKFVLIQNLQNLAGRLEEYNIKNDDLNLVLKFANNLSYNTLLSLSDGVVSSVEEQLARMPNE